MYSMRVNEVVNLDFPQPGTPMTIDFPSRDQAVIRLGKLELQGKYDRERREITGRFSDAGSFAATLDRESRRMRCVVDRLGDGRPAAGSFTADEDGGD